MKQKHAKKADSVEIPFKIHLSQPRPPIGRGEVLKIFTERPETIFGITYIVLPSRNELVGKLKPKIKNWREVERYITQAKKKSTAGGKTKNKGKAGVELLGIMAINPATKEEIPVWVSDYAVAGSGVRATMAVPAHSERDFEFALEHKLPIKQVIMPELLDISNPHRKGKKNTKRNTVHVILRDVKKKSILVMFHKGGRWKGNDPRNFIIGGIEDSESEVEAAVREIEEETGYTNFKFVEKIQLETQASFFAAHKDVNRVIRVHTLVFDLLGPEKVDITEDKYFTKDSHEMKWIPIAKVAKTITIVDDKMAWDYHIRGGFAYTGEGILINSGKWSGQKSEEVKKKIIKIITSHSSRWF